MDLTWEEVEIVWQMAKQKGVKVWSNAHIWMRDELRSKVRLLCNKLCCSKVRRHRVDGVGLVNNTTCY